MHTSNEADRKRYISKLTSAALFSITGKAQSLIEEGSKEKSISSWIDKKSKLYKLYHKYTKNCGNLLDENKSIDELREESKLVIASYIDNISKMI